MALTHMLDPKATQDDLVAVAEDLLKEAVLRLQTQLTEPGPLAPTDVKTAKIAAAEIREGAILLLKERNRVADERRKRTGAGADYALDFEAARDEIGRRLACLRSAPDG